MTRLGFTAARDLTAFPEGYIESVLASLAPFDAYVTGGARGGDALIGRWLREHSAVFTDHFVVLPTNRSQVDPWYLEYSETVTVIEMPVGSTYRDRNKRIVDLSHGLVGFPAFPEWDKRSHRSGTWQTIRLAKRQGKPVRVFVGEEAWSRDSV